jgi:hypothetical protein
MIGMVICFVLLLIFAQCSAAAIADANDWFVLPAAVKLNECQKKCIEDWLKGFGPANEQGCNFVGWNVASNPNCHIDYPTIEDAKQLAESWVAK